MSAALPSVTEVGMAAHLPGELGLSVEDDELVVTSGSDEISVKTIAVNDSKRLDTRWWTWSPSVTRPRGSTGVRTRPARRLLGDDRQAWGKPRRRRCIQPGGRPRRRRGACRQRLKQAGYTKFLITSDHGFLYTERLADDHKVDSPDLASVVKAPVCGGRCRFTCRRA